jgi:hypothetical protein
MNILTSELDQNLGTRPVVQDASELDFLTYWALEDAGHLNDIALFLALVAAHLNRDVASLTTAQFWWSAAMLGGFIGRRATVNLAGKRRGMGGDVFRICAGEHSGGGPNWRNVGNGKGISPGASR